MLKKHGLTIVKEYADEALSGRDDTRPQYQLLLSEIKTLKPAVLILWKTDRLGRDRYDLILAKKIIRDAGSIYGESYDGIIDTIHQVFPNSRIHSGKGHF